MGPKSGAHERTLEVGQTVQFQSHQTDMGADSRYLATAFNKSDRVYIEHGELTDSGELLDVVRDDQGNRLSRAGAVWQIETCAWTKAQRRAATTGDLAKLHGLLESQHHGPLPCSKPVTLDASHSQRIDALLQARQNQLVAVPDFVIKLLAAPNPNKAPDDEAVAEPVDPSAPKAPGNMIRMLDNSMGWYIEWPHIDQQFIAVYRTLPGFRPGL